MKATIEGIVDEVGAHLIDGKEFAYFDLKQTGDQYRPGEIVRISGSGVEKDESVKAKVEIKLDKGRLKIRMLKEDF